MTKVAINGFGRIGRAVAKIIIDKYPQDLQLVAINDLSNLSTIAHLFRYDSVYGKYNNEIKTEGDLLVVGDNKIRVFSERDPDKLPWGDLEVDVVIESTGIFRDYNGAYQHIKAGARKVLISAPSKDPDKIPSYIMGVNDDLISDDDIVDIGSCTTNCLAPVLKIIDDAFSVEKGFITTIHSYTSDQNLVDMGHNDLRRARAAALNMVPTTTGAAKAIGRVMPNLDGKIDGMAIRVPTATVSLLDIFCKLKKGTTKEELRDLFIAKSEEANYQGIVKLEKDPLVSSDYIGNEFSSIIDDQFLMTNGDLIKVVAWYDNEWGYSARLADFILKLKNFKAK
ncbi:MAG: type I glyceraldehyde-3-phosphate dehydrogenase [Patescibacteria group bacterium]|jgi:glyceraldehyde 3-phosphate dehydrogenase|nr:type I glyceraldehyde-3-phosphate dehydrogenase [Patescibacteria group bacterium]